MYNTIAEVNYPTHTAKISQDRKRGIITVFKHSQDYCQFESFTDQTVAADYIMQPLPTHRWVVNISDE